MAKKRREKKNLEKEKRLMAKFKLRNKLNDDSDFERILDEETKYIANEQSFKNENEQVSEEEDGPLIEQSI